MEAFDGRRVCPAFSGLPGEPGPVRSGADEETGSEKQTGENPAPDRPYDRTVSATAQESLQKALEIFTAQQARAAQSVTRPDVSGKRIVGALMLRLLATAAGCLAVYGLSRLAALPAWAGWAAVIGILLAAAALTAKRTCRDGILLYQRYAPERLRRACVFQPSCSEYMLLAIDKYGVVLGVAKGLKRLGRCHYPNGGKDEP